MSSLCEGRLVFTIYGAVHHTARHPGPKVMGRASGFSPLATLNEPDAVTMHGLLAPDQICLPP